MDSPRRGSNRNKEGLIDRLDRAAGGLNAVLLALAIGLAILDFTCFFAFELHDAWPSAGPASTTGAVAPNASAPATRRPAASAPDRKGGAAVGL